MWLALLYICGWFYYIYMWLVLLYIYVAGFTIYICGWFYYIYMWLILLYICGWILLYICGWVLLYICGWVLLYIYMAGFTIYMWCGWFYYRFVWLVLLYICVAGLLYIYMWLGFTIYIWLVFTLPVELVWVAHNVCRTYYWLSVDGHVPQLLHNHSRIYWSGRKKMEQINILNIDLLHSNMLHTK